MDHTGQAGVYRPGESREPAVTNKTNLVPGGPTAVNTEVQVFNGADEFKVFMTQNTHTNQQVSKGQ